MSLYQSVELPCVLRSQLLKLLAFQKKFVDEEDMGRTEAGTRTFPGHEDLLARVRDI